MGESGVDAELEIAQIATEGAVTLMGPNCMGMISNEVDLHAVGFVKLHPPKGTLSFVSQSGNMGVTTTGLCQRRGIGIDKFAQRGQRGSDRRRGYPRVPQGRPPHHLRDDVHRGPRRRAPLLGRGQAYHRGQAGSGFARRGHRVRQQGGCLSHRGHGRFGGCVGGGGAARPAWSPAPARTRWSTSAPAWPTCLCPRAGG